MVGAKIVLTGAKIFSPAHEECDLLDHLPRVQLRHSWGKPFAAGAIGKNSGRPGLYWRRAIRLRIAGLQADIHRAEMNLTTAVRRLKRNPRPCVYNSSLG